MCDKKETKNSWLNESEFLYAPGTWKEILLKDVLKQ